MSIVALVLSSFAALNVQAGYQVKSLAECKTSWAPSAWARGYLCDSTDWFFEQIPLRRMPEKKLKADVVFYTSLLEWNDPDDTLEEKNQDLAINMLRVLLGYALLGDQAGVNGAALKIKNELCPQEYFKNAFAKGLCENINQVALHPADFIEDSQCQSLYIVKEDIQRSIFIRTSERKKIEEEIKKNPNFANDQKILRSKYVDACPLRKSVREDKGSRPTGTVSGANRTDRASGAK